MSICVHAYVHAYVYWPYFSLSVGFSLSVSFPRSLSQVHSASRNRHPRRREWVRAYATFSWVSRIIFATLTTEIR